MSKTKQEVEEIISKISFVDRRFRLLDKGDGWLFQLMYTEPDVITGIMEDQFARKWYVSPHMTETEIVDTVFGAVCRSMMHWTAEHFTYKGRRVYSPHFPIDARIELCDRNDYDARPKKI